MAVGMCERSISNIELEKNPASLETALRLAAYFKVHVVCSSIWRKNIPQGSVMIIRHETVVFIPGRKYRSKTTGIDRLESVAWMH